MIRLRQASQVFFLILFLFLLVATQGRIRRDTYDVRAPLPAHLFFAADPLVPISATIASRQIVKKLFIPAVIIILLTVIFGRFFCGWICPLGTSIDIADRLISPKKDAQKTPRLRQFAFKYYLLFGIFLLAFLGINIYGFFAPISILYRSIAFAVLPYAEVLTRGVLDPLYGVPLVNRVSEPLYSFLKGNVLSLQQVYYVHSFIFFIIFVGILYLERFGRRTWCRRLCPLGAFYGTIARFGIVRRRVDSSCTECGLCAKRCRMNAIGSPAQKYATGECILCLECADVCPTNSIHFSPRKKAGEMEAKPTDFSRRGFLKAAGLSILALPILKLAKGRLKTDAFLLRPPGALYEEEFLAKCIRCGECMRVCVRNALQPAFLQTGAEGMWSPLFIPRIGYCEYNCNLCGKVCPTGAIENLPLAAKQKFTIGVAYIDKNRCIPWNENVECSVCEEVCPLPRKAIVLRPKRASGQGGRGAVRRPHVILGLCIGCGICENKCPVEGEAAIRVMRWV